jgi:hypothetical protein
MLEYVKQSGSSSPLSGRANSLAPTSLLRPRPPITRRKVQILYEQHGGWSSCCTLRVPSSANDTGSDLIARAAALFRQRYGVSDRIVSVVVCPR